MHTDTETPSPPPAPSRPSPAVPTREDCWSEDATFTLIDAWGDRYLECNRGNLRQKHWQEVAAAVNDRHAYSKATRRTDIQCKNRIDTLKKKYKIEKARVADSGGAYVSSWPFFAKLDALIGSTFPAGKKSSPPGPVPWTLSSPVPVAPRSATLKRPAPAASFLPHSAPPVGNRDFSFHRRFSEFAAAAAAAAEAEAAAANDDEEEEGDDSEGSSGAERSGKRKTRDSDEVGYRKLAEAIERFAEMYERVEREKQRQMIELEKQRMQFTKDLEFQRMQLIMETQVQLQELKRAKKASGPGE